MTVRYGGRGPGHLSRWPKAVGASAPPPSNTFIYPLDSAGALPEAAGGKAYGIIKGTAGYSGNCCRVVRDSDSSTQNIGWIEYDLGGGNSVYVWDYPAIETFLGGKTGGKIDRIYCQDSSGDYLSQTTDSLRPLYNGYRTINGFPAPDFVGDWMTIPSGLSVSRQAFDAYQVWAERSSYASNSCPVYIGDSSNYAGIYINADGASYSKMNYTGVGSGGQNWPIRTDPNITSLRGTASNSSMTHGNSSHTSTAGSSVTLTGGFLGKLGWIGGWEANARFMFQVVYGRNLSAGEVTALRDALTTIKGTADTPTDRLAFLGDSIAAASASASNSSYNGWDKQGSYGSGVARYNFAGGGQTVSALYTARVARVGNVIDQHSGDDWTFCLHMGTNDINAGDSASTVYGNIWNLCDFIKTTKSKKVICSTITPDNSWSGAKQTVRDAVTDELEVNYLSHANAIVKIDNSNGAGNSNMGDQADAADSTKYPDGLHPSEVVGYGYLTPLWVAAVSGVL